MNHMCVYKLCKCVKNTHLCLDDGRRKICMVEIYAHTNEFLQNIIGNSQPNYGNYPSTHTYVYTHTHI